MACASAVRRVRMSERAKVMGDHDYTEFRHALERFA